MKHHAGEIRAGFVIGVALCVVTALPAFAQQPDLGTEAQREAGRQLYDQKCSQCHGDTGAGDGAGAPFFRPTPRDFTTATYKFRSTASGELPTTADLHRSIREGMPYTGMPAWPSLSQTQVANLAYYLKTFSNDFSGDYGSPTSIDIPKPLGSSAESIARGREVFVENQCTDCHGDQGRGDGKSAPTLEDQWGYHIRPADLTKRWTFRNGGSREDIYRTFSTGLDGSPMPSYEIDPPEDKWHLVNYVYSLSRDEADYGTLVVAEASDGPIDLAAGEALFETATPAYFPVVGQVVELGRAYFSGVNGIEVKAVYNADDIAILLSWHDMTAETVGGNSPALPVVEGDTALAGTSYSDAVAIQVPLEAADDGTLPYFMFGDAKKAVDLWYVEMASKSAQRFEGKGSAAVREIDGAPEVSVAYADGRWTAMFKRSREVDGAAPFAEDGFMPVAFTVWDGFNAERGNMRGVTSWYYLYTEPLTTESPVGPIAKYVFLTLLLGFGSVGLVRQRQNASMSFMPDSLPAEFGKARVDVALDIIRTAIGVALFIRGVLWAQDSGPVVSMITEGDMGVIGSAIFIHFVIVAHIIGGLMLAFGFRTRVAAVIQIPVLIGAVGIAFLRGGLFMADQSFELAMLVLVILVVLALFGSGTYSLDHFIYRRHAAEGTTPLANMGGIAYGLAAVGLLIAILILGSRLLIATFTGGEMAAIGGVTIAVAVAFLIFYGIGLREKKDK